MFGVHLTLKTTQHPPHISRQKPHRSRKCSQRSQTKHSSPRPEKTCKHSKKDRTTHPVPAERKKLLYMKNTLRFTDRKRSSLKRIKSKLQRSCRRFFATNDMPAKAYNLLVTGVGYLLETEKKQRVQYIVYFRINNRVMVSFWLTTIASFDLCVPFNIFRDIQLKKHCRLIFF